MPGMSQRSLDLTNPFVVALFRHTSVVTMLPWIGIVALGVLIVSALSGRMGCFQQLAAGVNESRARRHLRVGFGMLWLLDGALQFQASMPLGLATNVVAPMSRATPSALQSLIGHAVNLWNSHPITLASGVAWLEIGLGLLLVVSNGTTGRVAAVVGVAWSAVIWLIGDGAGGLFVHGATILFGWPGAALLYAYAGAWIALDPERYSRSFAAVTRRVLAATLLLGAVEQALPAAGFWRGGPSNALSQMANYMSAIAQPGWLASAVRGAGSLAATMGGGLNVVILLWLIAAGVGLWPSGSSTRRWPLYFVVTGAVVIWVFAQDTGLFGGLATDVNTMPALAILAWSAAVRPQGEPRASLVREVLGTVGSVVAAFAIAMVLVASAAMGWAVASGAETTLFLARNGPAKAVNVRATPFSLIDQYGRPYRLGEHRGRVTLLTFLDPNCTAACAPMADQLVEARRELSARAMLDIVVVAVDPYHDTTSDLRRFIARQGLASVPNFYFLTGRYAAMRAVWRAYGISVVMTPSDPTSVHTNAMFVVAANGSLHWIVRDDPLASSAGIASAVAELGGLLAYEGVH